MRSKICILARYFCDFLQLEKVTHFALPKFSSGSSQTLFLNCLHKVAKKGSMRYVCITVTSLWPKARW